MPATLDVVGDLDNEVGLGIPLPLIRRHVDLPVGRGRRTETGGRLDVRLMAAASRASIHPRNDPKKHTSPNLWIASLHG